MRGYALRLTRDQLAANGRYGRPLPALNRVLYVVRGELTVAAGAAAARIGESDAWHGAAECMATAGTGGATVLRYELLGAGAPAVEAPAVDSTLLLEHPIQLEPTEQYLMRCDRVEFAPGGVALRHRHKGGGIRCLIAGTMGLDVDGEPPRIIHPGQAWFESGREPVYAAGDRDVGTVFIRCSILPRAIKGQSSIMYVDPADAAHGKPRQYTVFVDEPIDI